jgi:hypothetical protein
MSAARRKGSAFARDVCDYLADTLGLPIERRVDGGSKDRGDVAGLPRWVIEAKACRQLDLSGWMDEALKEAANDGAPYYAVIAKRRMKGTHQAYVIMPLEIWAGWYQEADR